jgi:drug/metabolite transporter (DMT)-like permease
MPRRHVLAAATFLVAGELVIVLMSGVIKHLSASMPSEMIVFFRNLFGLLFVIPMAARSGLSELRTRRPLIHLLRAASGVCAMFGFFYVIARMPLAEATLVKLTTPIFLPLIALVWLGEAIGRLTVGAIAIGLVGVLLILQPGTHAFNPAALVGLGAAVAASLAKVCIRKMADTEPPARVVFYFGVFSTLISALPLLARWTTPPPAAWAWVVLLGALGTTGQLLITHAYQLSTPGEVGPYTYTSVVFASLLGWALWGEVLAPLVIAGSVLVIGAGLLNLRASSSVPPSRLRAVDPAQ